MEFLTPDIMEKCYEILGRAAAAVRDDTIRRMRVECIELGLRYVKIRCGIMFGGKKDPVEFERFVEDCLAHNVTVWEVRVPIERCVQAFAEEKWRAPWTSKY